MQEKQSQFLPKFNKAKVLNILLIFIFFFLVLFGAITLGQEAEPELTWTGGYDASVGMEVQGLALIQTETGWTRVYEGDTHIMAITGHVNRYTGNNTGLDAEYTRVISEEIPNLVWTGSAQVNVGDEITGLALIETDGDGSDKWIRIYAGDTHVMETNGHVNYYNGNNAGLDTEYERMLAHEIPELIWVSGSSEYSGTPITGLALIQIGNNWIKVYEGETYTMTSSGHVNIYTGNNSGLNAEYDRMKNSSTDPIDEVAELQWDSWEAGNIGTVVEGLALIETSNGWIKVYLGYTYTMQANGNIHYYIGNNSGLDMEYNRLTQ